jgi:hypothetical protein
MDVFSLNFDLIEVADFADWADLDTALDFDMLEVTDLLDLDVMLLREVTVLPRDAFMLLMARPSAEKKSESLPSSLTEFTRAGSVGVLDPERFSVFFEGLS